MKPTTKMSISDRFKGYEHASRQYLPRRLPVIIRLDGKAFHTLTRRLERPFDQMFMELMAESAKALCETVQNCQFAYAQSDEISLLLINYTDLNTEPWFGNNKSKMESISASVMAASFNILLALDDKYTSLRAKIGGVGYFDSRAFIVPANEVCNYFIWRQQDATRNAVQMAAQSMFSHKSLQNLNNDELQEKMFQEKGVNFNDYPISFKRGYTVTKVKYEHETLNSHDLSTQETVERTKWEIDWEIPIFTKDRYYIERYIPEFQGEANG